MTFFPPQTRSAKLIWVVVFAGCAIAYVVVALAQIGGARRDEAAAKQYQEQSLAKIDTLEAQVRQLSRTNFRKIVEQAMGQQHPKLRVAPVPDLTLVFSAPSSVVITVLNNSSAVANKPEYFVALWDLDSPPNLLMQPLPIPLQTGDFVRPHEARGPEEMMGLPAVSSRVKQKDRIFGFASVTCPTCKLRRYYWLYIKQGSGGWYSETKPIDLQALGRSIPTIARHLNSALAQLVPVQKRIPIKPLS